VPWVDRSPAEIVREHFRLTVQPFDAPADAEIVKRLIEQIDCDDMLLFATDYPHWQFDGPEPLPPGFSAELVRKISVDNPLATYSRLKESVQ